MLWTYVSIAVLVGALSSLAAWAALGRVRRRARWGYLGPDGRFAITPRFGDARQFRQGRGAVRYHGRWGFVDPTGGTIVPTRFQAVGDFHEGLAWARFDGKIGFIDLDGNWVIEPRFDEARDSHRGVAWVRVGEAWGLLSHDEHWVKAPEAEPKVSQVGVGAEGCWPVCIDGGWTCIDARGQVIVEGSFEAVHAAREGALVVRRDAQWGLLDWRTGTWRIALQDRALDGPVGGWVVWGPEFELRHLQSEEVMGVFVEGQLPREGAVGVRTDAGWGYRRLSGEPLGSQAWARLGEGFAEGLAAVATMRVDRAGLPRYQWGFIDSNGELVVKTRLSDVDRAGFSQGLCACSAIRVVVG